LLAVLKYKQNQIPFVLTAINGGVVTTKGSKSEIKVELFVVNGKKYLSYLKETTVELRHSEVNCNL